MTSISAAYSNTLTPLQQLQDQLQAEVNSGAISSSDQGALSSALNDINSSLQSNPPAAPAGGTSSSPGDLKSKIDSLIANEVSSGKLTSDQATELQGVFKAAFAADSAGGGVAGGPAGPGLPAPGGSDAAGRAHHGHHGGGHGAAPPADSSSSSDSTSSAADILQQFLQSLQNSLSGASSSPYGATGSTDPGNSGATSYAPLLIDYQT